MHMYIQMIECDGSPRTRCWWRWTPSRRHRARVCSPWRKEAECEPGRRSAALVTWSERRTLVGASGEAATGSSWDKHTLAASSRKALTWERLGAPPPPPHPPPPRPAPPLSSSESSCLRPPDVSHSARTPRLAIASFNLELLSQLKFLFQNAITRACQSSICTRTYTTSIGSFLNV